jgi:hypothetical protein
MRRNRDVRLVDGMTTSHCNTDKFWVVLQVVLRGVGVKHDSDSLLRKRVHLGLVQSASQREAAAALEEILRGLHATKKKPEKIPEQWVKDHEQFSAAAVAGVTVGGVKGDDRENKRLVFWREGLGKRVLAAFDQLKRLAPARLETPPEGTVPCHLCVQAYSLVHHRPSTGDDASNEHHRPRTKSGAASTCLPVSFNPHDILVLRLSESYQS